MGGSRSQISQQIVTLLEDSDVLGGAGSAFEASLSIENYLASRLTFPIAAVETLGCDIDPEIPGRYEAARYRIGVANGPITETRDSNYVASGGSGSSQQSVESTIQELLSTLSPTPLQPGSFTEDEHGFQGMVERISQERTVVVPGGTYVVADIDIVVHNATIADTA